MSGQLRLLVLALAALPTAAVCADRSEIDRPGVEQPARSDDGRRTLGRFPRNVVSGMVGVFHPDNLVPLVAGSTATGFAGLLDDRVAELGGQDWGGAFETGGGPVWSSVFVASMFTAGRLAHGSRFRAMTYDMLEAALVNVGYTELLKLAVGRERPNGQDQKSFPSGHTSNAFALAAVAQRHCGWEVGVPAYLLAGVVGASRVEQDKHFLSDVVAGATLGYIVGRSVVRLNSRPLERGSSRHPELYLAPLVAREARGLQLSVAF